MSGQIHKNFFLNYYFLNIILLLFKTKVYCNMGKTYMYNPQNLYVANIFQEYLNTLIKYFRIV